MFQFPTHESAMTKKDADSRGEEDKGKDPGWASPMRGASLDRYSAEVVKGILREHAEVKGAVLLFGKSEHQILLKKNKLLE